MTDRHLRWLLWLAFSAAVGHQAATIFWPLAAGPYFIGGEVTAMQPPRAGSRQLYLRREFSLPRLPERAWVRVVGRDQLAVYVNGRSVGAAACGRPRRSSSAAAVLVDVTTHLQEGRNVVAVSAAQTRVSQPPAIAVEVGCFLGDREIRIPVDGLWKCSDVMERRGGWWFEPQFDDRHWQPPVLAAARLDARLAAPPEAVTSPDFGRWITSTDFDAPLSCVRRELVLTGRPRDGWLRLTANCDYRLAVNGRVLDVQEEHLGLGRAAAVVERTYDLSLLLQSGRNSLALLLSRGSERPQLRVDLQVTCRGEPPLRCGTDPSWQAHAGIADDWLSRRAAQATSWHACEAAGAAVVPARISREPMIGLNPAGTALRRVCGQAVLTVVTLLATAWVCSRLVDRLARGVLFGRRRLVRNAVCLALLAPTALIAAIQLAAPDFFFFAEHLRPGSPIWLLGALLLVPLQWAFLHVARWRFGSPCSEAVRAVPQPADRRLRLVHLAVAVFVGVGFSLRMAGLADDPLHPDETTMYRAVQGIFECGYPRVRIHENLPPAPAATSEAVYYGPALAELFFEDPRFVIRVPAVCFGTATIVLVYLVGRGMFGTAVGLTAAAIYTFAPIPIAMSNFGRYFSQLQFFTLLTVYLYYRTIAGRAEIDRRALWQTTAAFLAMYLSWEGSGVIAAGMVAACLIERGARLNTLFGNRSVWLAIVVVLLAMSLQHSHRQLHQASTLWLGTGARDIALTPMWRYPQFEPLYYFWAVTWQPNAFLPLCGLVAGALLAVRHRFAPAARYLLVVLGANCALFALLLPVKAVRYGYHLSPLLLLLTAAAIVAASERLQKSLRKSAVPHGWSRYAQGMAAAGVLLAAGLAAGAGGRSDELAAFDVAAPTPGQLRVADQRAATRFLLRHLQPGDVVLAVTPHVVEHEWELAAAAESVQKGAVNYWIESRLQLQPALDDVRTMTLHRLSGTEMISTVEELDAVFARHRRIWYLTSPQFHGKLNVDRVSSYLRQHMEVVYEDYHAMLLLRDAHHRPAVVRVRDEDALDRSGASVLP